MSAHAEFCLCIELAGHYIGVGQCLQHRTDLYTVDLLADTQLQRCLASIDASGSVDLPFKYIGLETSQTNQAIVSARTQAEVAHVDAVDLQTLQIKVSTEVKRAQGLQRNDLVFGPARTASR